MTPDSEHLQKIRSAQLYAKSIGALIIWMIYNCPKDYSEGFIARAYEVTKYGARATAFVITAPSLEAIQASFKQAQMSCLLRQPRDDSKIVENWL